MSLIFRRIVDGDVQIVDPTTAEQRLAKKNELKARGTLLMALPDKHQLKFNIYKDAKSLMEAIEKRFGVTAAPSITTASSKATVSTLPNVDSLSDAVIYSFFASQSNSPKLDNEDMKQIDPGDLEEMDLKSPRDNKNKDTPRRTVPVEVSTSNALVSQCSSSSLGSDNESQVSDKTGLGFDSQLFNSQVFDCKELHDYESDNTVPKNLKNDRPDAPIVEDWISDSKDETKIESVPNQREPSCVKSSEHVNTSKESVKEVTPNTQAEKLRTNNQKFRDHKINWKQKACFVCRSLNHLIKDCDYYEKQMVQNPAWNSTMRVNHQNSVRMTHPHSIGMLFQQQF
nr:hypothetical protein [Tanacetum cinerariifolium]